MEMEDIRGLVIGEPSFAGIVGLTNTAFTLRVSFTTQPLKQWTVRFALDSMVKKHFDLANVRAPVQTYQVLSPPASPPHSAGADANRAGGGFALPGLRWGALFAAFVIVHKGPCDKAALLLALRHLF